jgi:N utilization substance protein B
MPSRRRARQFALQALYQSELTGEPVRVALSALWAGSMDGEGIEEARPPEGNEVEFTERLVNGVDAHRAAIDAVIEDCSTNWRIPRMPFVDRNILRIAGYELMHCEDVPPTVAMNEAIELAKRYGTAESRAFVNGIVDRMARSVQRVGPS